MSDTTRWVIQISIALVCAIFIYQYIVYKFEMMAERKKEPFEDVITEREDSQGLSYSFTDILNTLHNTIQQGYLIGLDPSLINKYPQLLEHLNHGHVIITEEVVKLSHKQRVVGIRNFNGGSSEQEEKFTFPMINEQYIEKIGLDSKSISDRAIGSYLYAEKTNLINVKFATTDPSSFDKAKHVGLRSILF